MIIYLILLFFLQHLPQPISSNKIYNLPVMTSTKRYIWDVIGPPSDQLLQVQQKWTISNLETPPQNVITNCGGDWVVGGYQIITSSGSAEKTYSDLAPHSFITYQVNTWLIDTWGSGDSVSVYIDDVLIAQYFPFRDYSQHAIFKCGDPSKQDLRFPMIGRILHTQTSLKFRLEYTITTPGAAMSFFDVSFSFPTASFPGAKSLPCPGDNCIDGTVTVPVNHYSTGGGGLGGCTGCPFCWGSQRDQCFVCYLGQSFDGTQCVSCPTDCKICSNSAVCDRCNENFVLDIDKTCKSACSSPSSIQTNNQPYTACLTPCAAGQFRLWDYTCGTSCQPPLNQAPGSVETACEFPCNQQNAEYLYWNGTCKTTCPLVKRVEANNFKFCDACTNSNDFIYQDDTCKPTCQQYFNRIPQNGFWLCKYPCQDSEYLYQDGSCKSSCQTHFIERLEQNQFNFCDYPCPVNHFLYLNGSCLQTCQINFISRSEQSNFLFCEYPCQSNQYLNAQGDCQDECIYPYLTRIEGNNYHFCDPPCPASHYYFEDKSCSPTCPESMIIIIINQNLKLCNNPTLDQIEIDQINTLNSIHKTTQTIADSGLIIASLLTPQDPSRLAAGSLTRMLLYTRYLNITHSQKLEYMFRKSSLSQGIAVPGTDATPEIKSHFQSQRISYVFDKYNLNAGFLINFWKSLIFLLTLSIVCAVLALTEYTFQWVRNIPKLRFLVPQARILVQNFLLAQFFINYGDIIFFALIEFQSNKPDSFYAALNIIFASMGVLIGLIIIGVHFSIVQGYQEIKKEKIEDQEKTKKIAKFERKYIRMQILFKDFKTLTQSQQGFLLIHNIRNMIFNVIVAILYMYPLLQIIMVLLLNCFMIFYLLLRKPFLNIVALVQQIVFECVLFLVNTSWLIMAILDSTDSNQSNLRRNLSEVVIFVNVISTFLPISFLLVKGLVAIINSRKSAKNPPKSNPKSSEEIDNLTHEDLINQNNLSRFSQSLDHDLNLKIVRLNRELPQFNDSIVSESFNFGNLPGSPETRQKRRRIKRNSPLEQVSLRSDQ